MVGFRPDFGGFWWFLAFFGSFLFLELFKGDFADERLGEAVAEFVSGGLGIERHVARKELADLLFDAFAGFVAGF